MKQTLHIFRKDVKLYWAEIVATLAVTAMFVWTYPRGWPGVPTVPVWSWVPEAIVGLLLVSWLVLITRVIHAESLVGERQFWITRPYLWPQLLGAKALFLAVFLYVPTFLAQCILLRKAGMHPLAYLPGLFFNLLLVTGIVVLPMACMAAVTRNFAKTLLALLCLILFVGGVAYLSSIMPTSSSTEGFSDELSFVLAVSVFVAVLMIQYARRWTKLACALLVALAVTFSVMGLFWPDNFGVEDTYPVLSKPTGPHLAFAQVPAMSSSPNLDSGDSREFTMVFPVAISGIVSNTAVKVEQARVSFTAAGGARWISHWQEVYVTWLPGEPAGTVSLKISRAIFDRMKDKPVTVEISLAFAILKSGSVTRLLLPEGRFEIPGGSLCRTTAAWQSNISCLSPMRQPRLMLVETRFTREDCSAAPPSNDGDLGFGWIGTLDTEPSDFGLTSVWDSVVYFQRSSSSASSASTERQSLCPGSPLALVPYTVVARNQQKIASQPLNLKSLVFAGM